MNNILNELVEVTLPSPETFLKVAETLTRIGVSAKNERRLYPSCVLLHKQGKYYICHFKEMLALDGNQTNYSIEDKSRRNKIAALLQQWGLLTVVHPQDIEHQIDISKIKIIPYSEKSQWNIVHKYRVGKKR